MGDVVGLVKDFEQVTDQKQTEEAAQRMLKGRFTLDDLLSQLKTIQRMGPLRDVFAKLPMFGSLADQVDDRELGKVEAMIGSMTPGERGDPEIIKKSRASRIARGSGRRSKEVMQLVQRFQQMREMMGALGGSGGLGGLLSKVPGLGRLMGGGAGLPAGFDPSGLMGGGMGGFATPSGAGGGSRQRNASRQRDAQKKKRKQTRKDRRKGRKK